MKKVLSLVLVLVLALGMSTVAFATAKATEWGGTNNATDISFTQTGTAGEIVSGTKWQYALDIADFDWDSDAGTAANATKATKSVTASEVSKSKIKAVTKVEIGKSIYNTTIIEKEDGVQTLRVKMKDPILVTNDDEVDFEATVTMYVGGDKQEGSETSISGTFTPEPYEPEADDEGADISDGMPVMPVEYNPNWIATLDEDETIEATLKLFKNRNFYLTAKQEVKDADAETVDAYGFDQIYYLSYSANAVSSVQKINFVDLEDDFYVYGSKSGQAIKSKADIAKNLVLLGTSADDLPLYSMYYLASKQVDLEVVEDAAAEVLEPVAGDAPELAPVTGGDGYVANVNDNPGTGK